MLNKLILKYCAKTSHIYINCLATFLFSSQSPSASTARRFAEAQSCKRWPNRRNALADPFQMAIPQVTREKIERDIIHRKTSVSKRLSQFFRSKIEPQPETDLT